MPIFVMFPCKIGFNTEGAELAVGHWALGRPGFQEDEARVKCYVVDDSTCYIY